MATPTTLPATFVAGNVLTAAQMNDLRGAFRVLQVVSTTKTDTFTTSSTSFTDITGLTVSITPSATSSKILIFATVNISGTAAAATDPAVQLVRDSTAIFIGDTAGNRTRATFGTLIAAGSVSNNLLVSPANATHLDSPNTTSATTYKLQMRVSGNTGTVNRNGGDTDVSTNYRMASSITVMEISA
jgi:hypothetical protein